MRFLLDENFPLQLYRQLKAQGIDCEHIVVLGQRQMTDSQILERVNSEPNLVLLTQDREFETMPIRVGKVIISRLPQSLPTQDRVEIWLEAVEKFVRSAPEGALFGKGAVVRFTSVAKLMSFQLRGGKDISMVSTHVATKDLELLSELIEAGKVRPQIDPRCVRGFSYHS